jgi:hypothetical protein
MRESIIEGFLRILLYNLRITGRVEVTMRTTAFLCFFLGLLLVVLPARTQNVNLARPPEKHSAPVPPADVMRARMNNLELQKDAKELAEVCASIPADMDSVKRGLLPKDVLEKLTRVEKLSKRLREELTR